jgi:photosystem II stability/assembly factor-like uncharacterized protein
VDDLLGVSCPSKGVCEAVGDGDVGVLGTTNGGITWTPQTLPPSVESLASVDCRSLAVCEAVGQTADEAGAAVGTTDGGATWVLQRMPGASTSLPD